MTTIRDDDHDELAATVRAAWRCVWIALACGVAFAALLIYAADVSWGLTNQEILAADNALAAAGDATGPAVIRVARLRRDLATEATTIRAALDAEKLRLLHEWGEVDATGELVTEESPDAPGARRYVLRDQRAFMAAFDEVVRVMLSEQADVALPAITEADLESLGLTLQQATALLPLVEPAKKGAP